MATSTRNDPFTAFNFIVNIPGLGQAGFMEIGNISGETDIVLYRNGNEAPHDHKLPGKHKYANITFKRGYTNSKALWEWRKKVIDGKTQRLSGTVTLLDESRKPALAWHFFEGWPSKWAGPAFSAKNSEVAI